MLSSGINGATDCDLKTSQLDFCKKKNPYVRTSKADPPPQHTWQPVEGTAPLPTHPGFPHCVPYPPLLLTIRYIRDHPSLLRPGFISTTTLSSLELPDAHTSVHIPPSA